MIETVAIMGLANLISSREDIVHIQHYATTHKKRKKTSLLLCFYIYGKFFDLTLVFSYRNLWLLQESTHIEHEGKSALRSIRYR
jgi:hypothetical protein